MLLTVVLSLVMMASLFLMLYAAVALVQDKRLFTSAPKDIQAAVQPKAERFPGAHVLGWFLLPTVFLPVPVHVDLAESVRCAFFRLDPALPLAVLSALLPGSLKFGRTAPVRFQLAIPSAASAGVSACFRRDRMDMHAVFLRRK